MSKIKLQGNASGTGILTIESPNTNTDRSLTLPDGAGEILTDASSLPAANLTGTLPAIDGSSLTGLSAGAIELVSSGTVSDVSQLEVAFPTTYEIYKLAFTSLAPTTANGELFAQYSTDGGSTWDTGTNYNYNGSTYDKIFTNGGYALTALSNYAQSGTVGEVWFYNTQNTNRYTQYVNRMTHTNAATTTGYISNMSIGVDYLSTSVVNRVRFFFSSSNLSGTYYLYGMHTS